MANVLKFDKSEMEETAKAVIRFNKYAKDDSVENVVARMERVAFDTFHTEDHGYVRTYGFVLSAYRMPNDTTVHILSSVASHLFND